MNRAINSYTSEGLVQLSINVWIELIFLFYTIS